MPINISSNLQNIDNGFTKSTIEAIIADLNNSQSYSSIRYEFFYFNEVLPNTNPGVSYFDTEGNRTVGIGFNMDNSGNALSWNSIFSDPNTRPSFTGVYNGTVTLTATQVEQLFNYSVIERENALFGIGKPYSGLNIPNNIKLVIEDLYYNGGGKLVFGDLKTYITNYSNALAQNDANAANAALIAARDEILKESNLNEDNGLANRRLKEAAILMLDKEVKQPESEIQQLINAAFDRKANGENVGVIKVDGIELKHRTDYLDVLAQKLNTTAAAIKAQVENSYLSSREVTLAGGQKIYKFEDGDTLKLLNSNFGDISFKLGFADQPKTNPNILKIDIPAGTTLQSAINNGPQSLYEYCEKLEIRISNSTHNYEFFPPQCKDILTKFNGGGHSADDAVSYGSSSVSGGILVKVDSNTQINGSSYKITQVFESVVTAGKEVAGFINKNIEGYLSSTFDAFSINEGLTNFFSKYGQQLATGQLSTVNAVKLFALEIAESGLDNYAMNLILNPSMIALRDGLRNNVSEAQLQTLLNNAQQDDVLAKVLSSVGLENSSRLALRLEEALIKMAIDFALHSNDWDGSDYVKAGAAVVTGIVVNEFVSANFGNVLGNAGSAGTAAALTTLAVSLIDDGFNQNWGSVATSASMAFGTAYATTVVGTAIANSTVQGGAALASGATLATSVGVSLGFQAGTTAALLAGGAALAGIGIIIALAASAAISATYKGKVYYDGEYGDPSLVLKSVYQIQDIVVQGVTKKAVVAVRPEGSNVVIDGFSHAIGGAGADVLVDNSGINNYYSGGDGSDYLEVRAGDDVVIGGNGNDHINGGTGEDILQGDAGDDLLFGEEGVDTIIGGDGDDFIHGGSDDDILNGGNGRDSILAGGGEDAVAGEAGNDMIDGGYGNDGISGGDGNDIILGNLGNDSITGDAGSDTIYGDEGNDTIYGNDGNDFIDGGEGVDILYGDNGQDYIVGNLGDDFIDGALGDDSLVGGAGNDVIMGGMDNDYLSGEDGDDVLKGGYGNDILKGGLGADVLEGEAGNDIYIFNNQSSDIDNVINETDGFDTIYLQWGSESFVSGNLQLKKVGDNLEVSYGARKIATVSNHFLAGVNALERIEVSTNQYVDLSSVSYNSTTGIGNFSLVTNTSPSITASEISNREKVISDNQQIQNLYWNDSFLDRLSQIAYDEQLGEQTAYTYYNGTQVTSFFRDRGKFGSKYTVYKLDVAGNMNGTEVAYNFTNITPNTDVSAYDAVFINAQKIVSNFYYPGGGLQTIDFWQGSQHLFSFYQDAFSTNSAGAELRPTDVMPVQIGYTEYQWDAYQRKANIASTTVSVGMTITGGDKLVGGYWDEVIDGKSGDDILIANSGNDTLIGGLGDDWLFGGDGNDTLNAGDGGDVLFAGDGNDAVNGDAGDDAIIAGAGDDNINGGDGNDWVDASAGNDTANGNAGNDIIVGGDGNDNISGGAGADILHGDAGDDVLNGNDGDDTLYGNSGNDIVDGGNGNDLIYGGGGTSSLDGNDGTDKVSYILSTVAVVINLEAGIATSGASSDSLINIENADGSNHGDTITGNNVDNTLSGYDGGDTITGNAGNDMIHGMGHNDVLYGNAGYDSLNGGSGNDSLYGGSEDDSINGGDGSDVLDGGTGYDTAIYWYSAGAINVNLQTNTGIWAEAQGDTFIGIEAVSASIYNDTITGYTNTGNFLWGGNGNDTIHGGEAIDELHGNAGIDIVRAYAGNDWLTGNEGNDTLYGGSGNDLVEGNEDNDTLYGEDGDDTMFGGMGADILNGGNGYDTAIYWYSQSVTVNLQANTGAGGEAQGDTFIGIEAVSGSAFADTITGYTSINNFLWGGNGNDTLNGGENIDQIHGNANDDIIYGLGNSDTLNGNEGNDTIHGGTGSDFIFGNEDNDTLIGGSGADMLDGGVGFDTASYTTSSSGVTVNLQNLSLNTGDAIGDTYNSIEALFGSIYDDSLTGFASQINYMWGGSGNDSLTGGSLNDEIHGNSGIDIVSGASGNDWLTGNEGNDTLYGGSGNDLVEGNEDNDTLYGEDGDDTMFGGVGADILNGGNGYDTAIYWYSSAVNVNLQTNTATGGEAQGDTFIGIEAISGSAFADTITGYTSVSNFLWGGNGNDTLNGGENVDQIHGNANDDIIYGLGNSDTLNGNEGNDTIYGGTGADIISGNEGNDSLFGDSENDTIYGGIGNDTINGGTGSDFIFGEEGDDVLNGSSGGLDVLNGGAGADVFVFTSLTHSTTSSRDVIQDFSQGLDKLKLTGLASNVSEFSITQSSGNTFVNDLDSSFSFQLNGLYNLTSSDFIFV